MQKTIEYIKDTLREHPNDPQLLQHLGEQYLMFGHYRQAAEQFHLASLFNPRLLTSIELKYEKVLEADGENIGVRMSLADFYLSCGLLDEVILEFEEMLDIDPQQIEVYNMLGKIYLKRGRITHAIALLEKAFACGIRDLALAEMLGGAYLGLRRVRDAIALYEEMFKASPKSKKLLRILGELYTRVGEINIAATKYVLLLKEDPESTTEVLHLLEELLKNNPDSIYVREQLAKCYVRSIHPDAAVNIFREVIERDPGRVDFVIDNYRKMLKLFPDHLVTMQALADALIVKGFYSEAVEFFDRLMNIDPTASDLTITGLERVVAACPQQILAHQYLTELYLKKGEQELALRALKQIVELEAGEAEVAAKKCREIIKNFPEQVLAYQVLGEALLVKKDFRGALAQGEKAQSLDSKSLGGHLIVGESYARQGVYDKSVAAFRHALNLNPLDTAVHERLAEVSNEDLRQKIEALAKKIERDPWRLSLHLEQGKLYWEKGELDNAIQELQIALRDLPRAPFAYHLLGTCFKEKGRFDLAVSRFESALSAEGQEAHKITDIIRFNMGSALEAQGMVEEAVAAYEKIAAGEFKYGSLQEKIKRLNETNPGSLRNKNLVAAARRFGTREVIGFWGRDGRGVNFSDLDDGLSISFGQGHSAAGFEHFQKGRVKAAEEEFQLSIQLDAHFIAALNNLGVVYLSVGMYDRAEAWISEALELDPDFAVLLNNLSLVYLFLGEIDKARTLLEKAYSRDPQLGAAALTLGDLYYMNQETDKAVSFWERLLGLDVMAELAARRLKYRKAEVG